MKFPHLVVIFRLLLVLPSGGFVIYFSLVVSYEFLFGPNETPRISERTVFVPAVAQLVEALRYKPESSRVRFPMVSLGFFIDIILSALGSTQPLTEMSTRNISWG